MAISDYRKSVIHMTLKIGTFDPLSSTIDRLSKNREEEEEEEENTITFRLKCILIA